MLQQLLVQIRNGGILSPWVIGPAVFLLSIAILLAFKNLVLAVFRRYIAQRASLAWADSFIEALSPALTIVIVASGVALLDRTLPLSPRSDRAFDVVVVGALVLALVIFTDRICRRLMERVALRSPAVQGALGLLQGGLRGVVIGLGMLVFLDSIGISITPLIASLGVGSLAVALALQDTLANLFAGIYMIAEKPVEAGHFIKLETGEEGHVTRVGWRNTRVHMLNDATVVVPNSKLAGSVITNFSLPQHQLAVSLEIGVDYSCDLDRVEQVTLEVARELMTHSDGAAAGFESRMRYHTFADSSINFTVWLGARDFVSGVKIKHEFIKLLHKRYQSEEISIPFPRHTLEFTSETILSVGKMISQQDKNAAHARNKGTA
ncbi:MAG: mechanosensitive ion channel [Deltaproteobacteria bacterium]|nr:mechanosensitive ion channel [Deltaproteobacteria bacterium]